MTEIKLDAAELASAMDAALEAMRLAKEEISEYPPQNEYEYNKKMKALHAIETAVSLHLPIAKKIYDQCVEGSRKLIMRDKN